MQMGMDSGRYSLRYYYHDIVLNIYIVGFHTCTKVLNSFVVVKCPFTQALHVCCKKALTKVTYI